jgi:hypothetical protein
VGAFFFTFAPQKNVPQVVQPAESWLLNLSVVIKRPGYPAIIGLISLVCFGAINWQKNGGRKN